MKTRKSLFLFTAVVIPASLLCAADLGAYRDFHLGMSVADVAKRASLPTSDIHLIASRPIRIEELDWHASWTPRTEGKIYPFSELLFRFYDGKLYEMAVTYDRDQTRGLTEADLVDSVSVLYGNAVHPADEEVSFPSGLGGSVLKVIARWEDPDDEIYLVRLPYGPGFAMLISSRAGRLSAEQAIAESERLDLLEAPQRDLALRA